VNERTRTEMRKRVEDLIHSPLSDNIEDSALELPDAFRRAANRHKTAVPMYKLPGFEKLSGLIGGGLSQKGFTVITGPTGRGKTTLIGNLWFALSSIRKNVYTVPIEVGPDEFMDMLLSIIAAKTRRTLRAEDYEEARTKWLPTFFSNRGHVLATHESRLSHLDYLAEVLYHYETRNISVAFADNWNFMLEPATGMEANAMNDRALHDCIVFSKKVPVHQFMIMHPRKPEKTADDRVESIYDVKGSSTSIQEATNCWLFNMLEDDDDAPYDSALAAKKAVQYCREIKIAKARFNGRAVGSKVIYSIDEKSELYTEHGTTA
jgi:hypothetical protein